MAFWGFMVAALVIAGGMYWGVNARSAAATENPAYISTYTPAPMATLPPNPVVPAAPNLLFYGDSITVGSFAATSADTYRGRVVAAASENGPATPTVVATSGIRTESFTQKHPVAPAGIDLATVALGTNDVDNTDPKTFRDAYSRVIASIRDANPDAGLVCAGTWGPAANTGPYDDAIRSVCRSVDGYFVPLYSLYVNEKMRGPKGALIGGKVADNFHPNDAGHAEIAGLIIRALDFP